MELEQSDSCLISDDRRAMEISSYEVCRLQGKRKEALKLQL